MISPKQFLLAGSVFFCTVGNVLSVPLKARAQAITDVDILQFALTVSFSPGLKSLEAPSRLDANQRYSSSILKTHSTKKHFPHFPKTTSSKPASTKSSSLIWNSSPTTKNNTSSSWRPPLHKLKLRLWPNATTNSPSQM